MTTMEPTSSLQTANNLRDIRRAHAIALWALPTVTRTDVTLLSTIAQHSYRASAAVYARISAALPVGFPRDLHPRLREAR